MKFVDEYNWLIQYSREKSLNKKIVLYISSSKTEGEKSKTEERSKKCKIVFRFENRINRNKQADITIVEKILCNLPLSNLSTGYWQHPLKFQISARHCSMSSGIIIK